MTSFIICAGSSCPNADRYFNAAAQLINKSPSMVLHGVSNTYKNGSLATSINRMFYNCALAVSSHLEPLAFYRELKVIEHSLGRIRSYKNAPRTIDLDILLSLNLCYKSQSFFIPHPETFKRSFFVKCAYELIKSLGWPIPFSLLAARGLLAKSYLVSYQTSV